ncbi:MAG: hypothetical protein FWC40_00485, partial [Proteobacteria bacterium]|nr:hypothetical protein [Pseudomonadota bacterium]
PTLSPPPDPVQASSAALSSKGRGPARHRAPTCLPPSERELGVLHAIESAHDEDGESTIVVSALSDAVLPAPSVFPKQALISGQYTADVLIHILKFSRLMGQNMALEVTDAPRTIVLLVDAGRAAWGEILTSPNVQGYSEFLRGLAFGTSLSAEAIEGLMHQGLDMLTAVTSLGMQPAYFSVCERFIMEAITTIQALHGKPYAVYEGIPERYHRLQTERPALGIDVSQQVFDLCRTGQDTMSVPNAFRFAKFVARPHRTPWNASIQLNPQETSVQASLQSPTALERIQSHDALPLPGLLYRLVLFEFVDVAMGVVDQCCRIV